MPVMDGMEATRRIRRMEGGQAVKISALTASAFMEQQQEMLDAGMDDFVRKPFRFEEIYDCLAKHLGVKYCYYTVEDETGDGDQISLDVGSLARLPSDLRQELRLAVESLDSENIKAMIGKISQDDEKLAKALSRFADNFDYPSILNALDRVNDSR